MFQGENEHCTGETTISTWTELQNCKKYISRNNNQQNIPNLQLQNTEAISVNKSNTPPHTV